MESANGRALDAGQGQGQHGRLLKLANRLGCYAIAGEVGDPRGQANEARQTCMEGCAIL
jgi:hypothetical protein